MPILNACFDFDKTEISEIPHLVEMHLLVARRTPQGLFASRRDASNKQIETHLYEMRKRGLVGIARLPIDVSLAGYRI